MTHRWIALTLLGLLPALAQAAAEPPANEVFEAAAQKGLAQESCAPKDLESVKYAERDFHEGHHMLVIMSERSLQEQEGFAVGPFDTMPSEEQRVSLLGRQVCNDKAPTQTSSR